MEKEHKGPKGKEKIIIFKRIHYILIILFSISTIQATDYPKRSPSSGSPTIHADVIETLPEEEKESWSQKGLCNFLMGCLSDDYCYPHGYIKGDDFCGMDPNYSGFKRIKKMEFIEQYDSGKNCTYDFQCKSNLCFKGECEKDHLIVNLQQRIRRLELQLEEEKKKVEKLEEVIEFKSGNNKSDMTNGESNINNEEEKSLFEKIFGL